MLTVNSDVNLPEVVGWHPFLPMLYTAKVERNTLAVQKYIIHNDQLVSQWAKELDLSFEVLGNLGKLISIHINETIDDLILIVFERSYIFYNTETGRWDRYDSQRPIIAGGWMTEQSNVWLHKHRHANNENTRYFLTIVDSLHENVKTFALDDEEQDIYSADICIHPSNIIGLCVLYSDALDYSLYAFPMDSDNSHILYNIKQIVDYDDMRIYSPTFSSDGRFLAYLCCREYLHNGLIVTNHIIEVYDMVDQKVVANKELTDASMPCSSGHKLKFGANGNILILESRNPVILTFNGNNLSIFSPTSEATLDGTQFSVHQRLGYISYYCDTKVCIQQIISTNHEKVLNSIDSRTIALNWLASRNK